MTLRLRGTLAAVGLSMGWLAAAAVAVPPVLDRVPDNAMIVITAPSPDAVQKNIQAFVTATELPIPMIPKIEDLLASGGITTGLDTGKSLAVVVFPPSAEKLAAAVAKDGAKGEGDAPDEDEGPEDVVVLVPTSNYDELMKNFEAGGGAEKGADGMTKVGMPNGEDGFFRDVGSGYAAMSSNKDLLTKFEAKSGPAAIKGKLGKSGTALADGFDVVAIVNMDAVRPLWPEIKKGIEKGMKEATEQMPLPVEAPNPMQMPVVNWLSDMLIKDSRSVALGLKTGSTGMNMDLAVSFNDGTQMHRMFSGKASAGTLLSKLPMSPWLFAGAMDLSNAETKAFLGEMAAKGADIANSLGMKSGKKRIDASNGAAVVVGVPVGGIFGGLLTSTVTYTATTDAAAYLAAQKEDLASLNGQKQEEGFSTESTFKPASTKVDGVDVDEYSVKFKVDPDSEAAAMAPQMLNAIFGPTGGPAGYIAKADGGVYQTFGRNSQLLSAAMKAGKDGENLGGDRMLAQVADGLPANRIAEGYIGTKGLLDLIVPAAAMFTGVQVPPDQIPDNLPPIGMSVSGAEGSARLSLFVPAPVIRTAAKIGMSVAAQMEEGLGEDEMDAPKGDKAGTGQPKF